MGMRWRGIRGATTVPANSPDDILAATTEVLSQIMQVHDLRSVEVRSASLTTPPTCNAEFPAVAANKLGFGDIALLCGHEMEVPGSLAMCLRILLHVNTDKDPPDLKHIYMRGATVLRPDRNYKTEESAEADTP